MQSRLWTSSIPLWITRETSSTSSEETIPYIAHIPRLSYLPLLLPRLQTHFNDTNISTFTYEGITLKNLPVGLLLDLYAPELPWRIEVGEGFAYDVHDGWMNSVKEADFLRNGSAKGIMSMSKEHSTQLWNALQDNDLKSYNQIHNKLLNPSTPLRHIPLRIYIPIPISTPIATERTSQNTASYKIVQSLIAPLTATGEIQMLGSALNAIIPSLFPSKRDAILAEPILHGAVVPFRAPLEELMREAAYADGWLHLCVNMLA